jgi:hypothetical protein
MNKEFFFLLVPVALLMIVFGILITSEMGCSISGIFDNLSGVDVIRIYGN